MPVITLTGHEEFEHPAEKYSNPTKAEKRGKIRSTDPDFRRYIPPGSHFRIESCYMRNGRERRGLLTEGDCSGSISLNLDEGKYFYSVYKWSKTHHDDIKFANWFFVGMDEKQFRKIAMMQPKSHSMIFTSGGQRWRCNFPNCELEHTTMQRAVLHEEEDHLGHDPLGRMNRGQAGQAIPTVTPMVATAPPEPGEPAPPKKKRGRPRKNPVEH